MSMFKNHTIKFFPVDPKWHMVFLIRVSVITLLIAVIDYPILARSNTSNEKDTSKISFKLGENLEYKMKYGWFT